MLSTVCIVCEMSIRAFLCWLICIPLLFESCWFLGALLIALTPVVGSPPVQMVSAAFIKGGSEEAAQLGSVEGLVFLAQSIQLHAIEAVGMAELEFFPCSTTRQW